MLWKNGGRSDNIEDQRTSGSSAQWAGRQHVDPRLALF